MVLQWLFFCCGGNKEKAMVLTWFCLGVNETHLLYNGLLVSQLKSKGFTMVLLRGKVNSDGFTLVLICFGVNDKTLVLYCLCLTINYTAQVLQWFCLGVTEKHVFYIDVV